MVDYEPADPIENDRSAREEHDNIPGVLSNPHVFAGVVKDVNGELRHIACESEPSDGMLTAMENEYGTAWSKKYDS